MSKVVAFLSLKEEAEIVEAIRIAEKNTSGEIRVHLEARFTPNSENQQETPDAFARATHIFRFLHMDNTKQSNGVLIYVAVEDKKLVILGDSGINKVVPENFWQSTNDIIASHFKKGAIKEGLVKGILMAGEQLKHHFPYQKGDTNELSDSISVG